MSLECNGSRKGRKWYIPSVQKIGTLTSNLVQKIFWKNCGICVSRWQTLSDPAGGKKWRKVTQKDDIVPFKTSSSFLRHVMFFSERECKNIEKWGISHLRLRPNYVSVWRHFDVMMTSWGTLFRFIVILKGPLVTLPRFIANRSYPSFFWLGGHIAPPPGLIGSSRGQV